MLPSSNELIYFLEVSKTLNISRASERLGISQPSITSAIKKLEYELKTPLFLRHRKGVTLTKAGKAFQGEVENILDRWKNLKRKAISSMEEVEGHFRLGVHSSVALFTLPKILPKIIWEHPSLSFSLHHDHSRKVTEKIISMKIDLGIVVNPVRHPDLVINKLYDDEVAFFGLEKDLSKYRRPLTLFVDPDLLQSKFLLGKVGEKFDRIISTKSLELISLMVKEGAGIGIIPTRVVNIFNEEKKMMKIDHLPSFVDEHCLVYRYEQKQVKAIEFLSDYFRKTYQ